MRIGAAWFLLACGSAQCASDAGWYEVDSRHSQIRFTVKKWSMLDVEGFFKRYKGGFRYDPEQASRSSVAIEVETASVTTGEEERDDSLADPQFFDSKRVTSMKFVSTQVADAGAGELRVTGNLTIKDTAKVVTATARLLGVQDVPGEGRIATFSATFTIDRRDFQILGGSLSRTMIGNEVAIRLTLGGRMVEDRR